MIALTVMVYIQDQLGWLVGFAAPALVLVCSALMFIFGSSLYVKVKVSESPFSGFIQVLVIAFKNRKIILRHDSCYNHSNVMERVELTENLRFLNKACVVNDLNVDSPGLDSWSVSTVEKVESLIVYSDNTYMVFGYFSIHINVTDLSNPSSENNEPAYHFRLMTSIQQLTYGLAEAFNTIGQMEFYYSEFPKSMSSIAIAVFMVSNAFSGLLGSLIIKVVDLLTSQGGRVSWLSSDINVDYYYWFLSILNLLNFFYYLICCHVYRSSLSTISMASDELAEEGSDCRH
uniref:protein NRT1/ PTR FAMILY 1.2-like n=1 Tax=Erigeron canadensis TaxID=72917 RepID=UPI001CB95AA9|nr:protein NRT1/ PTR FAMILY 1.2-like [Erigeron canadensis]